MIDSHAHIQFEVYDEDREAMLKRAWDRGLSRIIVIGGEEKRNDQALALAKSDERLRAVIGIHPLNAGEYNPAAEEKIKLLLKEKEAVAIGEIGLSGEIRSVNALNQRLSEISRLGFRRCVIPANGREELKQFPGLKLIAVKNISEAIAAVLARD